MNATIELVNPYYYPLPPSVDDLLMYADDLEEEANWITWEWANTEIKRNVLGYVRAGLVAAQVRYRKLYQQGKQKFETFKDYCEQELGRSLWNVTKLIDAAKVVLKLARAGFTVLPNCEAQARPLVKLGDVDIIEKWREIVDTFPANKITADVVKSVVDGEANPKENQVKISPKIRRKLVEKAKKAGVSPQDLLEQLVEDYDVELKKEETADADSEKEIQAVSDEKLAIWQADLQTIVREFYGPEKMSPDEIDSLTNENNSYQRNQNCQTQICAPRTN